MSVWQVALWGNNVNDKRYIINATDLTAFYATIPDSSPPTPPGIRSTRCTPETGNTPRMLGVFSDLESTRHCGRLRSLSQSMPVSIGLPSCRPLWVMGSARISFGAVLRDL